MLRNIIIFIGFLVALDPYLGFPETIDRLILTTLGLALVFVTALTRPRKHFRGNEEMTEDSPAEELSKDENIEPRILHVERTEVEDTPSVHIERVTTLDKEIVHEATGGDTEIEKKTTVVRKRKRKQKEVTENLPPPSDDEVFS